jgi:hypothetical protein
MAKEKDHQLAYYYYVEKQKTAKETAPLVGVTEATMSKWVNKFGWKAQREAKALSHANRAENVRQVINQLAEQRITLSNKLEEALGKGDMSRALDIRQQLATVDDGAAKWNKTLEGIKKDGAIRLGTYLEVMEKVFNAMREYDPKLYMQTVDFQENHIHDISARINKV